MFKKTGGSKAVLAAAGAYCFLLSLREYLKLVGATYNAFGAGIFGYNIWSVLGLIGVSILIFRALGRTDKRMHVTAFLLGGLLSIGIVYGSYDFFSNDIFHTVQEPKRFLLVMGWLFALMPASEELLLLFDRLDQWGKRTKESGNLPAGAAGKFLFGSRLRFFLLAWAFIFACYFLIFLNWWPGNFVYDAPFQIRQGTTNAYDTHHPLIHTLLMYWAYTYGVSMGNAAAGFQFYTLLQMFLLSGAFAYLCDYLYRKKVSYKALLLVVLFAGLFPMNHLFAITATKDVLFAAFFIVMTVFWVRLIFDRETFKWYSFCGMILSGALCMMFRYNAVYALLAGGLIMVLLEKGIKNKLRILALAAGILLLSFVANRGLILATHAQTTDRYSETFCLSIQCLARTANYRGGEMDPELYNEICMYIPQEVFAGYHPYLADNIKSSVNEELLENNFTNYLKLFVKVGLRYPDEYLEAVLANTLAYWFPLDRGIYTLSYFEFYHKDLGAWGVYPSIDKPEEQMLKWLWPYTRLFWSGEYREIPVLGYLFRLEMWVGFTCFYYAWAILRKKKAILQIASVPLMYLFTCFLGPVPILRYIYNLIVIIPLLLLLVAEKEAGDNCTRISEG